MKIDFVKYSYPLLRGLQEYDGFRFLSTDDFIPMKLTAITNRGAKKDFYDIFELLKYYSLQQMLELFTKVHPDIAHFLVLKSLLYFDDAENQPEPNTFDNIDWPVVKRTIENAVSAFM